MNKVHELLGQPSYISYMFILYIQQKGISMQISGTETIRTQIQPSKRKREISKITNSQNTKRRYGQRMQSLVCLFCVVNYTIIFPYMCPLLRMNDGDYKMKHYHYSDRSDEHGSKLFSGISSKNKMKRNYS